MAAAIGRWMKTCRRDEDGVKSSSPPNGKTIPLLQMGIVFISMWLKHGLKGMEGLYTLEDNCMLHIVSPAMC